MIGRGPPWNRRKSLPGIERENLEGHVAELFPQQPVFTSTAWEDGSGDVIEVKVEDLKRSSSYGISREPEACRKKAIGPRGAGAGPADGGHLQGRRGVRRDDDRLRPEATRLFPVPGRPVRQQRAGLPSDQRRAGRPVPLNGFPASAGTAPSGAEREGIIGCGVHGGVCLVPRSSGVFGSPRRGEEGDERPGEAGQVRATPLFSGK